MTTKKHKNIIAPSDKDISKMAYETLSDLPYEMSLFASNIVISVEEFPDEELEIEMALESSFDLLTYFQRASYSAGVGTRIIADDKTGKHSLIKHDTLFLYRRPILDYWCESNEDLFLIVRRAIIAEIASQMGLCDDDMDLLEDDFIFFKDNNKR